MSDSPSTSPAGPRSDVPTLRAFVAVARCGTVGRAAGLLGRTQPSISARLAALERAWETRLFRRAARGMTLTPEGARLLPRAEAALQHLAELDRLAGLPVTPQDELHVGAGDALGRELLPRALAALLGRHPRLEVRLREGPGPALLDALREGAIDLALVVMREGEAMHEGLDVQPWLRSEIRLLVPAASRSAKGRAMTLEALAGQRLVALQSGSAFRRHLESAFDRAGLAFRPAVEVGNLSLVRRFVAAGLGVAPVPEIAFSDRDGSRGCALRRLGGVSPVVYARAARAGVAMTEPAGRLLELLKESGGPLSG